MEVLLLVVRLLLAVVFLVAGLAKFTDLARSRQMVIDFGLPSVLAIPIGTLLPLTELAVAVALIPTATAWWGALGALTLLLLFAAGVAFNLAGGRTPDCHCFGQLHSAPAGWPTLARNAALAVAAGFIVWQGQVNPGTSAVVWLDSITIVQAISLIGGILFLGLLAGEGWLLFSLLRQNGRLLVRIEALEAQLGMPDATGNTVELPVLGLPIGTPAPAFKLSDLNSKTVTLATLHALDKPVLLVFFDPGCSSCTALLPDLARWQRQYADTLIVALISHGTPEAHRAKVTELGLTHVLLQNDGEVAQAYQVQATPTAVLVRPDGTIGSALAPGAKTIAALVARTVPCGYA